MKKIFLTLWVCLATYAIQAQINTETVYKNAAEVIDLLKEKKHEHHHGHGHVLPDEMKLIDVSVVDRKATFYLKITTSYLEENFDELFLEEVGLRLFNVLPQDLNLNSFEILVQNRKGKYVSLDSFLPKVKDAVYKEGRRGDGGLNVHKSDDPQLKNNPVTGQAQPSGALSGKTVWLSPGHGWLYFTSLNGYSTQRGETNEMVEDFGTIEGINYYLLKYLWNAGANVWSVRERDVNTNEVIVDNTSPGYSESGTWIATGSLGYNPATTNHDQPAGYRVAYTVAGTADAAATFTPDIPEEGLYWVSVTYRSYSDRTTDAQYEVNHAGGTTVVSVNQEVHGATWVYLGQFYFDEGTAQNVRLINSSSDPGGALIADAVRFGGGVGTEVDCGVSGAGATGKPRFEESARLYAHFQGYPTCQTDPTIRPKYAEWELAKGTVQEQSNAIYLSWHTNAATGSARGTVTYANTSNFPSGSYDLQSFVHNGLAGDIVACWDSGWNDRGLNYANFSEVTQLSTMPGCLVEVAFHDNATDAQALTTPDFRELAARGMYHGIVDYFANKDNTTAVYMPEQPSHLYAKNSAPGEITLSWQAPPVDCDAGIATAYKIYMGTHGRGFPNGIPIGDTTTYTFTNLAADSTYYFRVSATNSGGESFPTAIVAARTPAASDSIAQYLIVDGFDRLDRPAAIIKTSSPQLTNVKRLFLELMNNYDYMVDHAKALEYCDVSFDGASNEAVISGSAVLTDYEGLDWYTGEESTELYTFDATEKSLIQNYLDNQGHLIVSGAEIGWDIGRAAAPNADLAFYNNYLKATYVGDDAGTYNLTGATTGIFTGLTGSYDDNTNGYFDAEFPDQLAPYGGSTVDLLYNGGTNDGAAIAYKGSDFSVVYFGFPLETTSTVLRNELVCNAVNFASSPPRIDTSCYDAVFISCGVTYSGASSAALSEIDSYACNVWTETGPERFHSITPIASGPLTATLSNFTGDLDVYILGSCDPDDCLGTVSSSSATFTDAIAGQTYYIVVDADDGSGSAYDLIVDCPPTDCAPLLSLTMPVPEDLYHADIEVNCNASINPSSNTSFKAGDIIKLESGFETPANTNFEAIIEDCQ